MPDTIEGYQADLDYTVVDGPHEEPDIPGHSYLISYHDSDGKTRQYTIYFGLDGQECMDVSGWMWEPKVHGRGKDMRGKRRKRKVRGGGW